MLSREWFLGVITREHFTQQSRRDVPYYGVTIWRLTNLVQLSLVAFFLASHYELKRSRVSASIQETMFIRAGFIQRRFAMCDEHCLCKYAVVCGSETPQIGYVKRTLFFTVLVFHGRCNNATQLFKNWLTFSCVLSIIIADRVTSLWDEWRFWLVGKIKIDRAMMSCDGSDTTVK